jgi:FkbM family methyltransferase
VGGEPLTAAPTGDGHGTSDDRRAERIFGLVTKARTLSARLPDRWDRRVRELGKAVVDYRGARRSYARQAIFSVLGRGSDALLAPFGHAQLLVPTDDHEIGRVVFATGGYERLYMAVAVAELERLHIPVVGTTFVDVGANIGTSTVDALVDFGFGRAVCFEPDERSHRFLLANVAINGLDDRVRAFRVALSDTDGSSLLESTGAANRADNRLVTEDEAGAGGRPVADVRCRRLDALVEEGVVDLAQVGLLWVDAQGHEPHVLEGATRALEAGVPLVMEYTPAALHAGGTLAALEAMVKAHYTTVIDLHLLAAGLRSHAVLDAADMGRLRVTGGREHTDLLILRTPADAG